MDVSTVQGQIAAMAARYPDRGLTSLNKYLDEDWLRTAFKRLRKDGAAGIDGVSATEYGKKLDERLPDLVNRAKSGSYRAPAVRRRKTRLRVVRIVIDDICAWLTFPAWDSHPQGSDRMFQLRFVLRHSVASSFSEL